MKEIQQEGCFQKRQTIIFGVSSLQKKIKREVKTKRTPGRFLEDFKENFN